MRRIAAETVVIVVETALVLALVAALGVPGGKKAKAVAEAEPVFCYSPGDHGPECGMALP